MFLLVTAFAIVVVFLYGCHRFLLDKRYNLPPGPLALPYIGNFYLLNPNRKFKSWVAFRELSRKYGPVFRFYLGHSRLIVLSKPDVIHETIVEQSKVLNSRPMMLPVLNQYKLGGVVFATGSTWQANRRFTMRAMRDFGMGKLAIVEKLHDEIGFLLAEFEATEGQAFEPHKLIANAVSNIICSVVFGKRFSYGDPDFKYLAALFERIFSRQFSQDGLYYLFPFIRHFITHPQLALLHDVQVFVGKLLQKSIAEHRLDFDEENIRDFPDLFLQAEQGENAIDFSSFTDIMIDMFGAGTETTTTAVNWTLLYFCKYPEVMKRCQQEIDNAIETNRLPELADRPKLAYIDAVMFEILRHVTIAPVALWHANLDGQASIRGFEIPKETAVCYNVWALHNDESYWKNPEVFDPNRWLDADGKLLTHSPYFMAFGTGPRVCLGEALARVEYFEFVVSILQRFTFTLVDKNVSLDDGINGLTHAPPKFRLTARKR